MKEQRLEVETFLPLDYLQAKPLKQRLRDIKEPRQVKLVYDVLKFDPPEIEKAVLFATNNALVCETPEDAMKVAYEIDRSRYDVSIHLFETRLNVHLSKYLAKYANFHSK